MQIIDYPDLCNVNKTGWHILVIPFLRQTPHPGTILFHTVKQRQSRFKYERICVFASHEVVEIRGRIRTQINVSIVEHCLRIETSTN